MIINVCTPVSLQERPTEPVRSQAQSIKWSISKNRFEKSYDPYQYEYLLCEVLFMNVKVIELGILKSDFDHIE